MKEKFSSHFYHSQTKELWSGRKDEGIGTARFHELMISQDLDEALGGSSHEKVWGILGFCCDEGIRRNQGREGAAQGPNAIRRALANIPVNMKEPAIFYDFGNIECKNGDMEGAQKILGEAVATLLRENIRPIVLGGGHETAWGNYLGIDAVYPEKEIGILNFDSHFDLRPYMKDGKGNSGTPFLQIADLKLNRGEKFYYTCLGVQETANTYNLFEKSRELNVNLLLADEFHEAGTEASLEMCDELIYNSDLIYLTICLDVFAAPFAPGVSAIQPLGLLPWHVIPAIRRLAASQKVVSFDIAELSPPLDQGEITAKLAASLISIYIHSS